MIRFHLEMLLKESELTFWEIISALNFIVLQNHAELIEVNYNDKPALVSPYIYVSFELSEYMQFCCWVPCIFLPSPGK